MQPYLYPGDRILVSRLSKGEKGDIVVIKNPQKDSVQKYLIKQIKKRIKNDIYIIGINSTVSRDSRHFGWVKESDSIGKMIVKFF